MKTKNLLLMICLLCSSIIYAQNSTIDKLFDKYEKEDDITFISISKAMFKMIPENVNTGNINIKNITHKIESMRIITSEKARLKEKMNVEFRSFVNNDKSYEELMRVRDGKSNVTINVRKKGDAINELVMLVNDESNFVFIQISGNFTLDDIQEISKNINIQ
jgi:nitrogenase molybdenum-iron protein alpha/beta subunit